MIYGGKPGEGGNILWGDEVTNIFDSAEFTGCYRVLHSSRAHDRPIMKIVADISKGSTPVLTLPAGTYWLAFSLDGSLDSGPWGVPNILDTIYTVGTAMQRHNGNWNIIKDNVTGVQASIPLRLLADGKPPQAAPAAPVVSALTDTSVTLETIPGAEYRLNDGAWQTDPEFTGLTPNTTYNLYARLARTSTHAASPASPAGGDDVEEHSGRPGRACCLRADRHQRDAGDDPRCGIPAERWRLANRSGIYGTYT